MIKKISPYLFPLGYACFGGLLASCFIHLSAFFSPFGLHGHTLRFAGVCVLLELFAIAALIPLVIGNYNCFPTEKKARLTLVIEVIESVVLFLPAMWLWSIPLDRISDYFLF